MPREEIRSGDQEEIVSVYPVHPNAFSFSKHSLRRSHSIEEGDRKMVVTISSNEEEGEEIDLFVKGITEDGTSDVAPIVAAAAAIYKYITQCEAMSYEPVARGNRYVATASPLMSDFIPYREDDEIIYPLKNSKGKLIPYSHFHFSAAQLLGLGYSLRLIDQMKNRLELLQELFSPYFARLLVGSWLTQEGDLHLAQFKRIFLKLLPARFKRHDFNRAFIKFQIENNILKNSFVGDLKIMYPFSQVEFDQWKDTNFVGSVLFVWQDFEWVMYSAKGNRICLANELDILELLKNVTAENVATFDTSELRVELAKTTLFLQSPYELSAKNIQSFPFLEDAPMTWITNVVYEYEAYYKHCSSENATLEERQMIKNYDKAIERVFRSMAQTTHADLIKALPENLNPILKTDLAVYLTHHNVQPLFDYYGYKSFLEIDSEAGEHSVLIKFFECEEHDSLTADDGMSRSGGANEFALFRDKPSVENALLSVVTPTGNYSAFVHKR